MDIVSYIFVTYPNTMIETHSMSMIFSHLVVYGMNAKE